MTSLVIHPFDPTTAFLEHIYLDKDWTVYNKSTSKKLLKDAIKQHDRIIMLGHGSEYGLMGFGRFVINPSWVYLLRQKRVIGIWCNADLFVKKYNLNADLYTGMIISDNDEAAWYLNTTNYTTTQINDSNKLFAEAIKNAIDDIDPVTTALSKYKDVENPIIEFNSKNIYMKELPSRCYSTY
jgi:hypothetical protein